MEEVEVNATELAQDLCVLDDQRRKKYTDRRREIQMLKLCTFV